MNVVVARRSQWSSGHLLLMLRLAHLLTPLKLHYRGSCPLVHYNYSAKRSWKFRVLTLPDFTPSRSWIDLLRVGVAASVYYPLAKLIFLGAKRRISMEAETETAPQPAPQADTSSSPIPDQAASLQRIQDLLKTKNDTSRFVGLALLKSVLDNSENLRQDENTVLQLWKSISPKFLDRLLRTGSGPNPAQKAAKEMLNLAVSVIHTFTILLPEDGQRASRLTQRIPSLVGALLYRYKLPSPLFVLTMHLTLLCSSTEATQSILETLLTLTSFQEGAKVFMEVEDVAALIEVAPSLPQCLDIFLFAWLNSMSAVEHKSSIQASIDQTIKSLASSFKGTDAITLLEFLGRLFRNADPEVSPIDSTTQAANSRYANRYSHLDQTG
jgi:hypothetical protein